MVFYTFLLTPSTVCVLSIFAFCYKPSFAAHLKALKIDKAIRSDRERERESARESEREKWTFHIGMLSNLPFFSRFFFPITADCCVAAQTWQRWRRRLLFERWWNLVIYFLFSDERGGRRRRRRRRTRRKSRGWTEGRSTASSRRRLRGVWVNCALIQSRATY